MLGLELTLQESLISLVLLLLFVEGSFKQLLEKLLAELKKLFTEGAHTDVGLVRFETFHKKLEANNLRAQLGVETCVRVLRLSFTEDSLYDHKLFLLVWLECVILHEARLIFALTVAEEEPT